MRYLEACFSGVEVTKDIQFAEVTNVLGEREKLKLDIYRPDGDQEANRPAILWIHGGGFKPGRDKSQNYIVQFATRFAQKGYVCVAPDYRVRGNPWENPIGTISDAVSDASCALDWVRHHSERYAIDSKRLIIAGGSAGGMIAVNLCYGDGTYGTRPDLSGVLAVMNLWGTPSNLCLDVHSGSIPCLTVHGTADELVKIEHSYKLIQILNQAGVPKVFIPLEGAPHTPLSHVDYMDDEFTRFLSEILDISHHTA